MKRIYLCCLILLFSTSYQSFSQAVCQPPTVAATAGRMEKYVYKKYQNEKGDDKELRLAVARPNVKPSIGKSPVVVGIHSGGFLDLCPFAPCYERYAEGFLTGAFSAAGATVISIEYRLNSPFDFKPPKISDDKLKEAKYKAASDARDALEFVFKNADRLGVDTENVFLVGTSAGAIAALHAAFLDDDETPKKLAKKFGRLARKQKIRGVISLAGAISDLNYLDEKETKIPLLFVHGTADFMVPIDRGSYLKMNHLAPVYGDRAVYEDAVKKGFPAKGLFYDYGHSLPERYSGEVRRKMLDFIFANMNCTI